MNEENQDLKARKNRAYTWALRNAKRNYTLKRFINRKKRMTDDDLLMIESLMKKRYGIDPEFLFGSGG